jgi:hypothetical protein
VGVVVGARWGEWEQGLLQVRSASARRGYRDCLDAYILPIIGATQLRELDTIRLNLLYVHLLEQGRRRVDRNAMMFAFYQAEVASGRQPTAGWRSRW